jgi:tRNA-specific 2-thiouridylase
VDSSVSAALLVQAGYRVIGVTLNVWPEGESAAVVEREDACCALGAVEDARRVASALDIPHYVVNFREPFQHGVIENFIAEYRAGRTPNPCVRCNQFIKFDALLAKANALGARWVATGHYARVAQTTEGRWALRRAVDVSKDQSYVLYVMSQERLSRALFPLGELTKDAVRQVAWDLGLHVAGKPESQEICFVPTRNYRDYLRQHDPASISPGAIVDHAGTVLGGHEGLAFFTIGQRRGLGIPSDRPLFVTELRPDSNTLVVGSEEQLDRTTAHVGSINWVAVDGLAAPRRATVKGRYKAAEVEATISPQAGGVRVDFDIPVRAFAPGQSMVFYDGDAVLGGGTVEAGPGPLDTRGAAVSGDGIA